MLVNSENIQKSILKRQVRLVLFLVTYIQESPDQFSERLKVFGFLNKGKQPIEK